MAKRENKGKKNGTKQTKRRRRIDQPDGLKCVSSIVLKTCPLSFSSSSALLLICTSASASALLGKEKSKGRKSQVTGKDKGQEDKEREMRKRT